MNKKDIKGIIPPILTPMNNDAEQTVNHEELRRQVDRAVEQALANRIAAGTACAGQHWTADCAADGSIVLREDETITL